MAAVAAVAAVRRDHMGSYGTLWDLVGPCGPCGAIWDHVGPCATHFDRSTATSQSRWKIHRNKLIFYSSFIEECCLGGAETAAAAMRHAFRPQHAHNFSPAKIIIPSFTVRFLSQNHDSLRLRSHNFVRVEVRGSGYIS